jgi:transcriptional regulator with XRE-family HTH domain
VSEAANRTRFGRNVRATREAKGWSQEDLAAAANMHFTAISRIERADREPLLTTVIAVAYALGVPPGDLFDGIRKP